jgi:hypothetical protein
MGAVEDIQLKHLHKIPEYNLYKVVVYAGWKEEYYCFTTVEAETHSTYYQKICADSLF